MLSLISCRLIVDLLHSGPLLPCACPACAASEAPRNKVLDRFFAYSMATGMGKYEDLLAPVKETLFGETTYRIGHVACASDVPGTLLTCNTSNLQGVGRCDGQVMPRQGSFPTDCLLSFP